MSVSTTVAVKISKTKTKRLTAGKKSGRNLIYQWRGFEDVFEADVDVASGLTKEVNLLAAKFPPRRPPCCLVRFSRQHNARVILILPLTEMYATVGSAIVCDRLRLYGNSSLYDRLRPAIYDP